MDQRTSVHDVMPSIKNIALNTMNMWSLLLMNICYKERPHYFIAISCSSSLTSKDRFFAAACSLQKAQFMKSMICGIVSCPCLMTRWPSTVVTWVQAQLRRGFSDNFLYRAFGTNNGHISARGLGLLAIATKCRDGGIASFRCVFKTCSNGTCSKLFYLPGSCQETVASRNSVQFDKGTWIQLRLR